MRLLPDVRLRPVHRRLRRGPNVLQGYLLLSAQPVLHGYDAGLLLWSGNFAVLRWHLLRNEPVLPQRQYVRVLVPERMLLERPVCGHRGPRLPVLRGRRAALLRRDVPARLLLLQRHLLPRHGTVLHRHHAGILLWDEGCSVLWRHLLRYQLPMPQSEYQYLWKLRVDREPPGGIGVEQSACASEPPSGRGCAAPVDRVPTRAI